MVKLPKSVNKVPSVLPEEITALIEVFRGNTNAKIEGIEAWNTKNIMNTKGLFSYYSLTKQKAPQVNLPPLFLPLLKFEYLN